MRIEEIHIHRFGGLRDLSIRGLNAGFNIIVGPNEAGKSTALEFIRSMFFGFRKRSGRSAVNTYETGDGASRHGCLVIRDGDGEQAIVQRTERPGKKEGIVTIADIDGQTRDPSGAVPILNNGMDRSAYEALFAFDLDGMRELDREALRSKIIAAAFGSLEVNPLDVASQLDEEQKRLVKRSSKNGDSLISLQSKLDELDRELRAIKDAPSVYARIKEELDEVSLFRQKLALDLPRKESALTNLKRILEREEQWVRLLTLEKRLTEVEDARTFPRNGTALMDQALNHLSSAAAAEDDLASQLEEFQRRSQAIVPDDALLAHAEEVQSLERRARMLASRPSEIDTLRIRIEQARRDLANDIHELGEDWTLERIEKCDISLPVEHAVQRYADAWKHNNEAVDSLERELATAKESLNRLDERVKGTQRAIQELGPACRDYLGPRERELIAEWKDQHRIAEHVRDRIADKAMLLKRVDAESREIKDERARCSQSIGRAASVAWTSVGATLFAALAAGAVFATTSIGQRSLVGTLGTYGSLLSNSARDYPFFFILGAVICVLVAIGLAGSHVLRNRRRAAKLTHMAELDTKISLVWTEADALSRELISMKAQLDQTTAIMVKNAHEAFGRKDVCLEEVLEAEQRSYHADGPVRRREIARHSLSTDMAEVERQSREIQEIERGLGVAREEFRILGNRWAAFLVRHGFASDGIEGIACDDATRSAPQVTDAIVPQKVQEASLCFSQDQHNSRRISATSDVHKTGPTGLLPENARELIRRLTALKREVREIADDEDLLTGLRSVWNDFASDVAAFADRIGREEGNALDAVTRWTAELNHAKAQTIEKQAIQERIADITARLERERKRKEEAENGVHSLLEQAEANDEAEFRLRAHRNEEFRRITDERSALVQDLVTGLRCADERHMRDLMTKQDWAANEQASSELASEIKQLHEQAEQLAQQAGRLEREAEEMETERTTERLLANKEELTARLKEGVRRWLVLRLASQLLGRTLAKCECEKQPKVMETSSEIFCKITGSAFTAVRCPMEGDSIRAVRGDGSIIEEGLLSRGTLEQVYLSMRLAHLAVHHHGGRILPLVMDDVLVNFDKNRAARTAHLLAEFADQVGIQVLFFTCHEHTAELFPLTVSKHYLMVEERP